MVIFERGLEGSERLSLDVSWGRALQAERTASAKALGGVQMTLCGVEEPRGSAGGAKVSAFWITGRRLAFTLMTTMSTYFMELL